MNMARSGRWTRAGPLSDYPPPPLTAGAAETHSLRAVVSVFTVTMKTQLYRSMQRTDVAMKINLHWSRYWRCIISGHLGRWASCCIAGLYWSDFIIRNAWHNKRELAVSNFCNPMTYSKINFMINLVSLVSFSKDIRTMNTWVLLCIFFGGDYKM